MDIVFFGSGNFAVPSLKALIAGGHRIVCVVTQPDRAKGRSLKIEPTAVKAVALEVGLKVYQPQKINSDAAVRLLKEINPDLFVVISYGQIISGQVLGIPRIFAVNIHASYLPKYRGASPINWAVIYGENTSGITIVKMTEALDAGPIILQEEMAIEDSDTALTLEEKLSKKAPELLMRSLKLIEDNAYSLSPQDESRISLAPKLKKDDGLIIWKKSAREIRNLIRGCLGWPGAFTHYKGKLLKIYKASVVQPSSLPAFQLQGKVLNVSKEGIEVVTGDGILRIEELQLEGKRIMRAGEFITGHKICSDEIFG